MNKTLFQLLIISALFGSTCIASETDTVGFQSIFSVDKMGPLLLSELTIIQDMEQLIKYMSEISSDTSQLSELPNFNSQTVIAFAFWIYKEHFSFSKSIQEIYKGDTLLITLNTKSQSLDTTIMVQPAYSVKLYTISKTTKPFIIGKKDITGIINKRIQNVFQLMRTQEAVTNIYDLSGRSSSNFAQNGVYIFKYTRTAENQVIIK